MHGEKSVICAPCLTGFGAAGHAKKQLIRRSSTGTQNIQSNCLHTLGLQVGPQSDADSLYDIYEVLAVLSVQSLHGCELLKTSLGVQIQMGVVHNQGPQYRPQDSRALIIRTPKTWTPNLRLQVPGFRLQVPRYPDS